ncbi:hypothetical protein QP166_01845 [Sphingomonas sp. LR60]
MAAVSVTSIQISCRRDPRREQLAFDFGQRGRRMKVARRDIERQRDVGRQQLRGCQPLAEHRQRDPVDQGRPLRDRDEVARRHLADQRAVPPCQQFDRFDPSGARADDRLAIESQFLVEDAGLQGRLDRAFASDRGFEIEGEDAHPPALDALGMIERVIGAIERFGRGQPGLRKGRDPQRAADRHGKLADDEGRRHRAAQSFADDRRRMRAARDQQPELVPAEPIQGRTRREQALHPLRQLHQQDVADMVTEGVVDRLEAIEVEQPDRKGHRIRAGHQLGEIVVEAAAVGKPRQAVGMRQPLVLAIEPDQLLVLPFEAGLRDHLPPELVEAVEQHAQQHGEDHRDVHRHDGAHPVLPRQADADEGRHHDQAHQHRGLWQRAEAEHAADRGGRDIDDHMRLLGRVTVPKKRDRPTRIGERQAGPDHRDPAQLVPRLGRGQRLAAARPARPIYQPHDAEHAKRQWDRGAERDGGGNAVGRDDHQ